jgi:hypothetical protein
MALGFLKSATGDPINTKRRVAQQSTLRVPATTGWVDFRSNGGPIAPAPSDVERLVIGQSGAPSKRLPGKTNIEGGPFSIGDVDVSNRGMIQFLANVFKKYTLTDNTTWYQWRFGLDETTSAASFLSMLNDNDVVPRTRYKDMQIGGFSISAGAGENLAIEFPFLAGGYDFHGDGTQTSGTGSTVPILEHTWEGNWEPTVDKDIFVEIQAGTATLKCKIGSASTFDGAAITFVDGGWVRLTDETDARIGEYGEQIRLYMPSTPTLTANDVFEWEAQRASWSQTLGVERPIASVNTAFILGGEEIRVEGGWNIEAAWENFELLGDTSGKQGATPERTGELQISVTPTRTITDLDIQKALHEGTELSLVIDCVSDDEIGASGEEYLARLVFPALKPSGAMFGTEPGGESKDETVTLTAGVPDATFNYDGEAYDSHMTVLLQNDVDALGS